MILNKIKLNYHIKLIDDYFKSKNFLEVKKILLQQKKNVFVYAALLNHINENYLSDLTYQEFYNEKIILLTSFDQSDNEYIINFLNYYFKKTDYQNFSTSKYTDFISFGAGQLNFEKTKNQISFEEIVNHSNLFQTSALLNTTFKHIALSTSAAFFETPQKKYFIYPNSTIAYLHVIRNPIQLYLKIKHETKSSQQALNFLNFFDQNIYDEKQNQINANNRFLVPENKQSWNIHTQSWIDENVMSTYRGRLLKYEDLILDPFESLVEVLFHFKQAGLEIDIDYLVIKDFVENHKVSADLENNLSKQELKMLAKSIDRNLLKKFDYQI